MLQSELIIINWQRSDISPSIDIDVSGRNIKKSSFTLHAIKMHSCEWNPLALPCVTWHCSQDNLFSRDSLVQGPAVAISWTSYVPELLIMTTRDLSEPCQLTLHVDAHRSWRELVHGPYVWTAVHHSSTSLTHQTVCESATKLHSLIVHKARLEAK